MQRCTSLSCCDFIILRRMVPFQVLRNRCDSVRGWILWQMLLYWPDAVQQGARRRVNSNQYHPALCYSDFNLSEILLLTDFRCIYSDIAAHIIKRITARRKKQPHG